MSAFGKNINNYFKESSLHGLLYISTADNCLERFVWTILVIVQIILASFLVQESWLTWEQSPVVTSVDLMGIENLDFPAVTFCPPGQVLNL